MAIIDTRILELTVATTANGYVIYGVDPVTGMDYQIPFALFQQLANNAITLAGQAKAAADTANTGLLSKIESTEYSATDYPEII